MATIGTLKAKLLVQVGDNTPNEVGDFEIQVEARSNLAEHRIEVDQKSLRRGMAKAFREAAEEMDPERNDLPTF